jgi:hypothetical protein
MSPIQSYKEFRIGHLSKVTNKLGDVTSLKPIESQLNSMAKP